MLIKIKKTKYFSKSQKVMRLKKRLSNKRLRQENRRVVSSIVEEIIKYNFSGDIHD